ncbi:PilW family protein [Ectothiorhodospiraceae bacterium 2226]|nr:PilW family protein [Ectothiorhodospiraceae bacterium 2226]
MSCRTRQAGVSLVEILIALTLSLILMAGVLQVLSHTKRTYTLQDALARVQENGRFAIEVLGRDLRMAGYLGCNGRALDQVVNTLNDSDTLAYDFADAIRGFGASGTGWQPPLDSALLARSPLAGSDIVTLTALQDDDIAVVPPFMNNQSATLHAAPGSGLQQFDIVLVGDCRHSAIMQITNNNPSGSGELVHNTGLGTPGNATSNLGAVFQGDAEIGRIVRRSYFLRTGQNGRPALWQYHNSRPVSGSNPAELISNVERMVVRYGVDTTGDRQIDAYHTAAEVETAGLWPRVLSARLALLLASADEVQPREARSYALLDETVATDDGRVRRVFATTVTLRNRAP